MELLSVVIFMAILCGAGAWLASLLQDRESGPIGLGRSWLLGCATLSLALHVPLAVDGQITHRSFGLAAVACVGASILFVGGWWKRRSSTQWGGWLADLPWAGRLVAGAIILAATSHALRTELTGYDARSTFALKARILYDTGDVAGEDFRDVQRVNFNPLYPLLLPLIEAETYWCQGSYEHPGLRLLFVGFVLAIVSVHAAEIRRFAPANIAAFQALLLLLTPMMIDCGEGAGLSGSADLPLAAFVFAGTLDLFRFCRQPTWRRALSAGLLFGAALMTKQEGQLWVVVAAITALGLLVARRFGPILPATRHAIPGAVVLCAAFGLHVLVHRSMPVSPYYPSYVAALTDVHWLSQLADRPPVVVLFALRDLLRGPVLLVVALHLGVADLAEARGRAAGDEMLASDRCDDRRELLDDLSGHALAARLSIEDHFFAPRFAPFPVGNADHGRADHGLAILGPTPLGNEGQLRNCDAAELRKFELWLALVLSR